MHRESRTKATAFELADAVRWLVTAAGNYRRKNFKSHAVQLQQIGIIRTRHPSGVFTRWRKRGHSS
jgi:hypothetical protein